MKKGQGSAAGAAVLVIILTIMILLYLIFLPDDVRSDILGDEASTSKGSNKYNREQFSQYQNTLLSQNVGRIFPPSPDEIEHNVPSFTIFTNTNAVEVKRMTAASVKRGVFTDDATSLTFPFDRSSMNNVLLSFNAKKSGGDLVIKLNGAEIFSSVLETASPPPISLPASMLSPMNELTFEAESPGVAFWKVNSHDLANIIISAEVTDRSAASASQHFSVPPEEYDAMVNAELSFLPNCDPKYTGRLSVSINNREVFSGFADCGIPNRMEVSKELLFPGSNSLSFVSEYGQYLVDLVKLTSKLSGQEVPIFYFNLPNFMFERVQFGDALLFVSLRFTDARSRKAGVLNINGYESSFQVADLVYQVNVDPEFLLPGPNSVIIMPQGSALDVVELKVEAT